MEDQALYDLTTRDGIFQYLKPTKFAAYEIVVVKGGFTNFLYRVTLLEPLHDGISSVIVKHAEGYVAGATGWKTDAVRQDYEYKALTCLRNTDLFDSHSVIQLPKVYTYDRSAHILIMEDLGPLPTLKTFISSLEPSSPVSASIPADIGSALGQWLAALHTYSETNPDLSIQFANNDAGRILSSTVHGRLPAVARDYGVGGEELEHIAKIFAAEVMSSKEVLTHGDLWTGNILVQSPSADRNSFRLFVLDWEACKPGPAAFDVGQFTAEAHVLSLFPNPEGGNALARAFMESYKESRRVDASKVAVRVGAHLVVWTPLAHWTQDNDELKQVMQKGVELVKKGHERDEGYLKTTVISELL